MYTMGKSAKKPTRKSHKRTYTFRRSRVPPRRSRIMRGGQNYASFSNSDVAASPQSYIPYNNFSNDPGYSTIAARNTGPFLTGTVKGGRRRNSKKFRGGDDTGAAGILSKFSSSGSSYNTTNVNMVPLA